MESAQVISEEPVVDQRTIADLHQKGYTSLTPELVKDILYLEQLASSTSQRIDDLKPVEILQNIPRGDKRQINKVFFQLVEDRKAVLGSLDKETFERIQRALFDVGEKRRQRDLDEARYQFGQNELNIMSQHKRMLQYIKNGREVQDRIRRLEGRTLENCMEQFQVVMNNPFFTFERFAFSTAYFVTTNHVMMKYKNTSLGIDQVLNFGKIRFALDIAHSSLTASKAEHNLISPTKHYHPFISASGDVCFGTSGDAVYKMLIAQEWGRVFEILASLLTTYDNGANPYISFGHFSEYEKNGKAVRYTPEICAKCTVDKQSCQCPYCSHCDERGDHVTEDCTRYCNECERLSEECICGQPYCEHCDHYANNCDCSEEECADCAHQ